MKGFGKNIPFEEYRRLQESLAKVVAENERLREENRLLREKVDFILRRMFGSSSEKLHPGQLELMLSLAEEAQAAGKDAASLLLADREAASAKPRAKREVRERVPAHLPAVEEVIEPEEVAAEPAKWRRIGEERTEMLDCDPTRYYRRVIVRPKYVSRQDKDAAPVIAPLPAQPQERCIAAPGLLASIAVAKYCDHLPLYRQESILRTRHGIALPRSTLARWMDLVAFWLEPVYRHLRGEVLQSGYVQIDETPIEYLDPGNGKTRQGYFWTAHAPGGDTIFHWETSRAAACLENIIPVDFTGTLQCDAYAAYSSFAGNRKTITLAGCWAHARRHFHEARDTAPLRCHWILRQIGHLYSIERKLRDQKAGPELRAALRAAQSRPILLRIHRALEKMKASKVHLPQSGFGKAIAYTLENWTELTCFADDGRIEIDNNLVENAIRPTAIGKKNWLFIGDAETGQRSAIIYTLIECCRHRGIDPQAYLRDLLTRLPAATNKMIPEFTPAKWAKARGKIKKAA
jgi:transposase